MSAANIARRYAAALFEVHQGSAIDLDSLNNACLVVVNEDALEVIASPSFDKAAKADMVKKAIKAGDDNVVTRLIDLLAVRDKLVLLPEIKVQFDVLVAQSQSEVDVAVTVAAALSDKEKSKLIETLKGVAKGDVRLKIEQDESILGGIVIQLGDRKIDCSVRGKLDHLRHALVS